VALGTRRDPEAWRNADLRFDRGGGWSGEPAARNPWPIEIDGLTMELRPTEAGQVGLFPEHGSMLPWLRGRVAARNEVGEAADVLHLFAYTGLATLAMAAAGAAVTHVDAARPTVAWARRNADLSGLAEHRIRWIVDDAVAFTEREVRRGRRYAGLVLDPPSYGHAPDGTAWRIDDRLAPLLAAAARLLDPNGFVLLTAHTAEFTEDRLAGILGRAFDRPTSDLEAGALGLTTPDGRHIVLGAFARTTGGA
jgi:23S rRNA (cytosine1962-C5)-methyltransferase